MPHPTAADGDQPEILSLDRLVEITRADWGWDTTFTDNLAVVGKVAPGLPGAEAATAGPVAIASR